MDGGRVHGSPDRQDRPGAGPGGWHRCGRAPRAGTGNPPGTFPARPARELQTGGRWLGLLKGGRAAGRIAPENGSKHLIPGRRSDFGGNCQSLLAMGRAAHNPAGPGVHSTGVPPGDMEDSERSGHPQTREARLLQGAGVPGDLAAGRHQQAPGKNSSASDRGPPGEEERATQRPVWVQEKEVLRRCGGDSNEPHPEGVGEKEGSRGVIHGRQVGIQRR